MPPPAIYVAAFLVGAALELPWPTPNLPVPIALGIGALGIALWVVLDPASMWTFRQAGTEVPPGRPSAALVREGPYRFSRNPMYLGMLVLYAALSLALGLLWALVLLPVVFVILDRVVVRREEAYLERRFGEEYRAYRSRVRRWV